MNISSIVIRTKPEHVEQIVKELKEGSICEYHLHDEKGRIIVTLEGKGVSEEVGKLRQLQQTPLIISAEMMYSYSEDELDELKTKLENSKEFPDWLNDENIRAEDIKYHGDLKKRI